MLHSALSPLSRRTRTASSSLVRLIRLRRPGAVQQQQRQQRARITTLSAIPSTITTSVVHPHFHSSSSVLSSSSPRGGHDYNSSSAAYLALTTTVAAAVLASTATSTASCEEAPKSPSSSSPSPSPSVVLINEEENTTESASSAASSLPVKEEKEEEKEEHKSIIPLWPNGFLESDVDALVTEIINDPSINLSLVPDSLEAHVYKSTIKLTLNAFYSVLSNLDGAPILNHEVKLTRTSITPSTPHPPSSPTTPTQKRMVDAAKTSNCINEDVLEQVADRLLANPTIRSKLVPDAVERQLYVNCLKVIFRVLQLLANSFRIRICGHDIRLALEPSTLEQSALTVSSSLSQIDMELLQAFAQHAGIQETTTNSMGWWDRLWVHKEFTAHLHATLYGLILGIVDDILANTQLQILSDVVDLDIVPLSATNPKTGVVVNDEEALAVLEFKPESVSVASFAAASFAAGVGVGVTLMAVLTSSQQR
jgi:hypothetical protein